MTTARASRASGSNQASAAAETAVAKAKASSAKAMVAIFTRPGAKIAATLFITQSTQERAPVFGGYLGGEKVSAFLRKPQGKKPFLSLMNNKGVQVATANFLVRHDGVPVLRAVLADKTQAWFGVSKKVTDDMLAQLGADIGKLHVKTEKVSKEAAEA